MQRVAMNASTRHSKLGTFSSITYLKTSPNLSDTRIVWLSAVNATLVGFLGSSLAQPIVSTEKGHEGEDKGESSDPLTDLSLDSFMLSVPVMSQTLSILSSLIVATKDLVESMAAHLIGPDFFTSSCSDETVDEMILPLLRWIECEMN